MAVYKPGGEVLLETDHAGTLISDFYLPELGKNKFPFFEAPHLCILLGQPELANTALTEILQKI